MDIMKIKITPSIAMKKSKKRSIVSHLPQDLLVQIAMHVVSTSPTPMKDVKNLRTSCKEFYRSSNDRLVGRSMAVIKESDMQWLETDDYFALLRHCAESGNLDAYILLGVHEIFYLKNKSQGLQHLKIAVDGGHLVAAYLMGVILILDDDTRSEAMEILNKVSSEVTESTRSGNPRVDRCRRKAIKMARRSWNMWKMEAPILHCEHELCGRIIKADNYWMDNDRLPRTYCSQICRWTDECRRFFLNI